MRHIPLCCVVYMATLSVGFAQHCDRCDRCDQCAAPYAPECCQPQQCAVPQAQPEAAPQGAYVAPVARGETAGESESLGLRFGSLRIPEFTIKLPTIQLPHLIHLRRDAEMYTEAGTAPFVRRPMSEFRVSPEAAAEAAPEDRPEKAPCCVPRQPCGVPPAPAACAQAERELRLQLQAKESELSHLQDRLAELEAAVNSLAEGSDRVRHASNDVTSTTNRHQHSSSRARSNTHSTGQRRAVTSRVRKIRRAAEPQRKAANRAGSTQSKSSKQRATKPAPQRSGSLELLGMLTPEFKWFSKDKSPQTAKRSTKR